MVDRLEKSLRLVIGGLSATSRRAKAPLQGRASLISLFLIAKKPKPANAGFGWNWRQGVHSDTTNMPKFKKLL